MQINALAASGPGAPLEPFSFEISTPGPEQALIRVSHCGICHSDLHLIKNDWRSSSYPLVPGHEVVGEVVSVGSEVKNIQPGMRVGVGWQSGACLNCEWCISGQENLCKKSVATCVGRHGGFADHLLTDARFAFPIPENMASEDAAPLLCGGITVYSPLRRYDARPWHKVAILGIGGLGHLALQFAAKMGCEVTALSTSPDKESQAKALGATHFINTRDESALKAARESFDFILVSATADLDWMPYVRALRPNGKLCFVTGEKSMVDVPISALLGGQKSVSGSIIGGRAMMMEMLEFAARHGIHAQTETLPLSKANEALLKVAENKARYRMVLKMD
jgi:uncharacterized zinc-type alcohol dehydrogenase-like protein